MANAQAQSYLNVQIRNARNDTELTLPQITLTTQNNQRMKHFSNTKLLSGLIATCLLVGTFGLLGFAEFFSIMKGTEIDVGDSDDCYFGNGILCDYNYPDYGHNHHGDDYDYDYKFDYDSDFYDYDYDYDYDHDYDYDYYYDFDYDYDHDYYYDYD